MKYLKTFLNINEVVGVPMGIINLSIALYNQIIEHLKSKKIDISFETNSEEYRYLTNEIIMDFTVPLEGMINDYQINQFNIDIISHSVKRPEEDDASIIGAHFRPDMEIDRRNFKMVYNKSNQINLGIKLDFPWYENNSKEFWIENVLNVLIKSKSDVISSLSHEMMHSYDLTFIKGGDNFTDFAKYQAVNQLVFGIKEVDSFFFYLYFMSKAECVVKSAEVAAKMEAQGITKDDFLKFLNGNEIWSILKKISEWDYDTFKNNLKDDIEHIKLQLKKNKINIKNKSDDEVIQILESLIINNIISKSADFMVDLLKDPEYMNDPFISMILNKPITEDPDLDIKQEFLDKFLENLKRDMKNPKYYFEKKEKFFKFESNKLIRKLSKLFTMAKDVNKSDLHTKISNKVKLKSESVLNWEKYQEFIGVKPYISKKKYI
jgi:hypothetical protein